MNTWPNIPPIYAVLSSLDSQIPDRIRKTSDLSFRKTTRFNLWSEVFPCVLDELVKTTNMELEVRYSIKTRFNKETPVTLLGLSLMTHRSSFNPI